MKKNHLSLKNTVRVVQDNYGSYPFNISFSFRKSPNIELNSITGPGIYFVTYKKEVIYIGKFQPVKNNNIFKDRWLRHLESMTMRGKRIGFGKVKNPNAKLNKILSKASNAELNNVIAIDYTNHRIERYRDTGVVTSYNRIGFANDNWTVFGNKNDTEILTGFVFNLVKLNICDSLAAKSKTSSIENELLCHFKPVCNKEYKLTKHQHVRDFNTEQNVLIKIEELCNKYRIAISGMYKYK